VVLPSFLAESRIASVKRTLVTFRAVAVSFNSFPGGSRQEVRKWPVSGKLVALRARLPVILRATAADPETGEFPRRFPEPASLWIQKITGGAVHCRLQERSASQVGKHRQGTVKNEILAEVALNRTDSRQQGCGKSTSVRTLERSEARPLASDASSAQTDAS
jgi:hypothetical protein